MYNQMLNYKKNDDIAIVKLSEKRRLSKPIATPSYTTKNTFLYEIIWKVTEIL